MNLAGGLWIIETVTETVTIEDWEDGDLLAVGRVPSGGFEWRWNVEPIQGVTGSGPWLCLKDRGPQTFTRYPVLRQRQALAEFVAIDKVEPGYRHQSILEFANRRGVLGQKDPRGSLALVEDQHGARFPGEELWFWDREVSQLAALRELHGLIPDLSRSQPKALAEFDSHVKSKDDVLCLLYGRGGMVILDQRTIPGRRHRADQLTALILEAVERKLRRSFSLVFRPSRLVFMPASLLEALYLAFAVAIVGRRPAARLCRCGCGEEFHPTRRDQQYVDESHGARERRRRIRARERGEQ